MKIDVSAAEAKIEDLLSQVRDLVAPAPPPRRAKKFVGLALGIILALLFGGFGFAVWKVPNLPPTENADNPG